jgi:hexosaminidase
MKKALLSCAACTLVACSQPAVEANYQVIPLPQSIETASATAKPFLLSKNTVVLYPAENNLLQRDAEFLSDYIKEATGYPLKLAILNGVDEPANSIVLTTDTSMTEKEGYKLTVTENTVKIVGKTEQGVFYGVQTLRKSIPAVATGLDVKLPAVTIADAPRFGYRGMHLDVCRHFFSLDFVKHYIDLLALHNMNTFHWHLTDDQGWRMEIKKYPLLTEIGSKRPNSVIGRNTQQYDNVPVEGFYTQDEMKEIVKYAAERYITVIPEVDLPGHMLAALAAYPELGCTGGPYKVSPRWGIFDEVLCIGNPETMDFLKDVMKEVMEIFPSKYIHIGGDECPRTSWKKCPKCQALIKKLGLKSDKKHTAEDRLQSYCMSEIEKYLNANGRQIIGWDEILEGDVAPNATVMSWRGTEGGIEAAKLGHDVIMTPTTYCYFDYYQTDDPKDEPVGIGGYVPLEKVYSFEPTAGLDADEKQYILGAQANLWTEYIATPERIEFMVLPRMAALSEVQWTQPEKKNYEDFARRLPRLIAIYQREGFKYADYVFDIEAKFQSDAAKKAIVVTLSTVDDAPIYYTTDGSEPTAQSARYTEPINVTSTADFRAVAIRPTGKSREVNRVININKATFCPITLTYAPARRYTFGGASTLVDGLSGNDSFATGAWLGFIDHDAEAVIDLGQPTTVHQVTTHAVVDMSAWVMASTGVTVSISADGKEFTQVADKEVPARTDPNGREVNSYTVDFTPVEARYVKVVVKRTPALPEGHDGAGKPAYLFVDEITVD